MPVAFRLRHQRQLAMTIAHAGMAFLLAALVFAVVASAIGTWSAVRDDARLLRVSRSALYATALCVAGAVGALELGFLTHDFSLAYVAEHIDSRTPLALAASGLYSGQEGSLLYWTLALLTIGSLAIATAAAAPARLTGYATALLAALGGFLLILLVFVASPFATLQPVPPDGLGLNPILRDQGMLIHPPFLLAGYSSFAVPGALAAAALLSGSAGREWFAHVRRFALLSWGLQAVGLTLGMWWAYHVLGWGGYWGWDPVENVALMPWLVMTAYIHTAIAQERRGSFRAWTLGLVLLAACLSLFGTFVVRSGVIQSVHSFAVSALGPWFLALVGASLAGSLILFAVRAGRFSVASEHALPGVSRENAFLLNNLLLLGIVAAIFWGTMLPLVSGLVAGAQAVVGPGYYATVAGPLFLLALALLAAGQLVPWRGPLRAWLGLLRLPLLAAAGVMFGLVLRGAREPGVILAAAVVVAAGISTAMAALRSRTFNRRRHGAYLAHLGLVIVAAGIAGSQLGQQHAQVELAPGQHAVVAGQRLSFSGLTSTTFPDSVRTTAHVRVNDESLDPGRTVYSTFGGQSASQVAIRSALLGDVYVVLVGQGSDGSAVFSVFVNPLVPWIWTGATLLILGVLLGNLPGFPLRLEVAAPNRRPVLARPAP